MQRIRIRPFALRDITEAAEYFEAQSGYELAERFVNAAESDFERLCRLPDVGSPCHFQRPDTQDIRRWPIEGFERWLIFYKHLDKGIEIVRVLHGARNISEILD